MALTLWILSLVAAVLTLVDQLRRSPADWIAADRDRGSWVTWTGIAGVLFVGQVAAIAYAIRVLPRFARVHEARRVVHPPPPPSPPPAPRHVAPARLWSGSVPPARDALPESRPRRKLIIEIDDL